MGRSTRAIWLTAVMIAGISIYPVPTAAAPSLADAVKAAYLTKFAPFVTWPADTTRRSGFTICIVGADPFGDSLNQAVAGQTVDSRPYQVVRVDTIGSGSTCDIAFIGGSKRQGVADALAAVRGTSTLTVTDERAPPGIINFKMQGGKVRFRIDQIAAERNGLVLSSKLLSLAVSIKTEEGVIEP